MNPQNCYWGYGDKFSMRPENWPRNILRTSKKLQGVELYCKDFEEIINNAPDGAFLFVDPPYYNADQDKFYNCTMASLMFAIALPGFALANASGQAGNLDYPLIVFARIDNRLSYLSFLTQTSHQKPS